MCFSDSSLSTPWRGASSSLLLAVLLGFIAPTASAQIYVDKNATGANDGTSWTDAYTDLQTAIDNATAGNQLWVAEGVYTPATAEDSLAFGGGKDGVELYGGFAGGESTLSGRDPEAHVTVFSNNTAIRGGAIANRRSGATLTLVNATLADNAASSFSFEAEGGALFNEGSATIENTILWGNSASNGGGEIHNDGGTATLGHSLVDGGGSGTKIENVNGGSVTGDGNTLDQDPLFAVPADPTGLDGTWATADDGLNVAPASPVVDAGDAAALPSDAADLDDDGDTSEPIPLDLTGAPRSQDVDTSGSPAVYFYRMQTEETTETHKMVHVR